MASIHFIKLIEYFFNLEFSDSVKYVSEHLNHQEHVVETQIKELKRLVVAASQTSAKSDAELAKALNAVHHDLDDVEKEKDDLHHKVILEPNQIFTGIGIIICAAVIFGSIMGRVS